MPTASTKDSLQLLPEIGFWTQPISELLSALLAQLQWLAGTQLSSTSLQNPFTQNNVEQEIILWHCPKPIIESSCHCLFAAFGLSFWLC